MSMRAGWLLLAGGALAGCATKGQVRLVETQVAVLRAETARRDSARAAELARIIRLQQQTLDSLASARQGVRALDARLGNEMLEINRQLIAVQELTGQSQARLSRLQAQLDNRAAALDVILRPPPDSAAPPDSTVAPDTSAAQAASADQMYQGALQQHRRGSVTTARRAFRSFLETYPEHPLVPDAIYYIGDTYETVAPDSAVAMYQQLLATYPQSSRAASAQYRIGLIAERRGDAAAARAAYQRVIDQFPRSEEADLARSRLASLKP